MAVRTYGPEKSVADLDALKIVIDERPDIFDHNVETVVRLFKQIQPQDRYEWAMTTLSNAKQLQRPCLCVVSFS
jgi:lipoic acid synthetase